MMICAPHPAALFSAETVALLADIAGQPVVAVGPTSDTMRLEQLVDAMEDQRQALSVDRWVIWGMSGGSFLAQLYAKLHPNRLTGLILASSGPYFRPTVEDPQCVLCPRNSLWLAKLEAAGLLNGDRDARPTAWQFVDSVGWVFRRAHGPALLVSPDTPSEDLKRIMPALWAFDARSWLPQIVCPALVVCGTSDPIVPLVHARHLADLLPNATFAAIERAGHIPLSDQRSQVERTIRSFLGELS